MLFPPSLTMITAVEHMESHKQYAYVAFSPLSRHVASLQMQRAFSPFLSEVLEVLSLLDFYPLFMPIILYHSWCVALLSIRSRSGHGPPLERHPRGI